MNNHSYLIILKIIRIKLPDKNKDKIFILRKGRLQYGEEN